MSPGTPPVGGLTEYDDRTRRLFAGPPPVHPSTLTAGRPTSEDWAAVLRPAVFPGELGRLGPYRVLGVLGRGGMGVVFLADDPGLSRRIALKTLLPGAGKEAAARFLREARAQAAIEHDHVVPVHQVGEDAGVPFLAMPLLQGQTLAAALAGGKLPPAEVVRVGTEVADGLAAAHARGLIHRDIKPGNVWLEGDRRRVKILDFGLARATGVRPGSHSEFCLPAVGAAGVDALTECGETVGTPAYMSPEQARGQPVDHRTDLFSLGALLYHAATGVMPFAGADSVAVMAAVTNATPPAPAALNPTLPAGLNDLIVRLLAKDPADRPRSAGKVAAELRAMLTPPPARKRRWSRRRRLTAGAVLAVVLGMATYFALPYFGPPGEAGGRLTELVLRHNGEVELAGRRFRRGGETLPPRPHRPTAVTVGTAGPRVWKELFDNLSRTDSLTRVEFNDSPLTDDDLAVLAALPVGRRLESLAVAHCPHVTERGLAEMARMSSLRRLRLDIHVTPETVQELAAALPRCRIEWPGGVVEPAAE